MNQLAKLTFAGAIVFALACGLTMMSFAQGVQGQARAVSGPLPVTITDAGGRTITLESLPPDARAQVERVRAAGQSLRPTAGGVEAQRFNIGINCSWPPLKCTITISF